MGLFTVHNQRGVHIFSKHKSSMYTFVQQKGGGGGGGGGGSRMDPNHKSMYKCAYMYVHLSQDKIWFLSFHTLIKPEGNKRRGEIDQVMGKAR